ncbi:alpha-internexin isoform X2 [Amia ocellicauda]
MQLERQVVLLAEGLSSQAARSLEVENALGFLTDRLRALLSVESYSPEVSITRPELTQLIETCGEIRQKLHRNNKVTSVENLSMPWLLSGRNFTKEPITLLDLCYGKTNNLNLQQVSALEAKLSQLFKQLHGVRQTLGFILAPGPNASEQARQLLVPTVYARLFNHASQCQRSLEDCCSDLLTLSLIIPSAPWARSQQQVSQNLTAEKVLAVLPAFPRGAPQQRARRAAEALVKTANYSRLMALQQVEALQAELEFHRSLYHLQIKYTEALIQGIRQAYRAFQDSVTESLCSPLQDVLSCYGALKSTASEAALRDFLTVFKNNSEQIQEAVEALRPSKDEGDQALSRYGKEFFQSVEQLLKDCADQRDSASGELKNLKAEYERACESLQMLKAERREKSSQSRSGAGSTEGAEEGGSQSEKIKGEGERSESALQPTPIVAVKPQQSVLERAPSVDVTSSVSEGGVSQQALGTRRPPNDKRGKSLHRSGSMRARVRPSWQN